MQAPVEDSARAMLGRYFPAEALTFRERPFRVLIAGAGTGMQAVAAAIRYGPKADVLAVDFAPRWRPRRTLGDADRKAINAQVAHTSANRVIYRKWRPVDMTVNACEAVVDFGTELKRSGFAEAIETAVHTAEDFLRWAGPADNLSTRYLIDSSTSVTTTSSEPFVVSSVAPYRGRRGAGWDIAGA